MSKIGNQPIIIPQTVTVSIDNNDVIVKGKEGQLTISVPSALKLIREENQLLIKPLKENKKVRSWHGLYRQLIYNAVVGVEKPWIKKLEVVGTGFNVKQQGEDLVFKLGYSHPVIFKKVAGVKFQIEGNNKVNVIGIDKQLVGEVAYKIKTLKKPDAYKGKGIRYLGENIRLKPGKKVKAAGAGTA